MTPLEVSFDLEKELDYGDGLINFIHLRDIQDVLIDRDLFNQIVKKFNDNKPITRRLVVKLKREVIMLDHPAILKIWKANSKGQEKIIDVMKFYNYRECTKFVDRTFPNMQIKPFKIKKGDTDRYYEIEY